MAHGNGNLEAKVVHYTDKKGKEGIERTGHIEPSPDGAHGPGVYVTTIPPSEGKKTVSENNWDGSWKPMEKKGRADYALVMDIPDEKLKDYRDDGRDILVHDGPVDLKGTDHQWKKVPK